MRILPLLLLLPQAALACPVCFGKAEGQEGLINGLTIGLFVLLAATFLSLCALAVTIYRVEKAREAAEAAL